jgi:cytochrome c oxidase accessory protein FixG
MLMSAGHNVISTPSREAVTTINADGSRRFIHAATARGFYTRLRGIAGVLLLAIYVGLPWIPINGHPALFFDLANRQFHLFGFTLLTQDFWLAFFLVTGAGFALFYLTAVLGRVWCGWACPQTVFLDVIRRIERWIEGDAPVRRRLDASPWTLGKTVKRSVKQAFYVVFALLLAHVFMSYFTSIPGLYRMIHHSPVENWGVFLFVFLMAGALWFDFAWFREQFCIVMCPYGRLQSALIDTNSIIIGYDIGRGEPRGKKGTPDAGDCVNCLRCVQVCPTGIDIRQGLQLECISCAACIDACDAVMKKVGRATGLIRYDSMNGLAGKPTRFIRPRMLLYTALMLVGAGAMLAALSTLRPANVSLLRMTGAPYYLDGESVRNQFLVRIFSKRNEPATFHLEVKDAPAGLTWTGAEDGIPVTPLGEQMRPVVFTMPRANFSREFHLHLRVATSDGRVAIEKDVPFLGPRK